MTPDVPGSRILLMWLYLLACTPTPGKDDSPEPVTERADPATVRLAGACPLADRRGGFSVTVTDLYSTVGGSVANAVLPISVLTEVEREGDCMILRRENPFCDPSCTSGEACDFDGSCIPYPETVNLGTVEITGLKVPVSMEPVSPGSTYFATTLPNPAVAADAAVELRADGLNLYGVGPEPLVSDSLSWALGEDPLSLTWTPPTGLKRSSIFLRLTVDQHGITPQTLVCNFPDTGQAEVPLSLLDTMLKAGVTGYPNGILSRRTVDSAPFESGCADLTVGEDQMADVTVSGHVPCDSHDDCPFGQRCNFALETCE